MTQEEIDAVTNDDIQAAADRLRRFDSLPTITRLCEIYSANESEAFNRVEMDRYAVSDAYLALGKRLTDETRILADGRLWDVAGSPEDALAQMLCDGYDDAKLVTVAVFVNEVQS